MKTFSRTLLRFVAFFPALIGLVLFCDINLFAVISQPLKTEDAFPFTIQHNTVTIPMLLNHPGQYHQHPITIAGIVSQPELHLDESELYIDFVFRLAQGEDSIVVFGRHDRTQGTLPIALHQSVQVKGIFWETLNLKGSQLTNVIEALSLSPNPSLIPEKT